MSLFRRQLIGISPFHAADVNVSNAALGIGATTHRLAIKFFPPITTAIRNVDFRAAITGTVTGQNFTAEIQTDSSDVPSGTILGAATAAFAGPAGTGFLGLKALGANTGALTINTPCWLVIRWASGSSPDASNFLDVGTHNTLSTATGMSKCRKFNGTNWTTVPANTRSGLAVLECTDGSVYGFPIDSIQTQSGATDIFGANVQGIRIRFGAQFRPKGCVFRLLKTGVPSSLLCSLYEGSTLKTSGTLPQALISSTSNTWTSVHFDSPTLLAADTDIHVIFSQVAAGGDNSNDYDLYGLTVPAAYIGGVLPPNHRYVSGSNADPALLTASGVFLPFVGLFVDDPAADFDMSGAGGETFTGSVLNRGIN